MSRIARFAVLVAALMSLFAVMSSTAGAVTWDNSGDTAFTAHSSSNGTLSVTGVELRCVGADATGTSPSAPFVGVTYPGATGNATFNSCTISGLPTSVSCAYTLTGTSQSGGIVSGATDANCSVTQFGTEICKIEGQTAGSYTNPSGGVAGSLTLTHSATLRTTNGAGGNCPLGAGEPATLTTHSFAITAASGGPSPNLGPVITRTP